MQGHAEVVYILAFVSVQAGLVISLEARDGSDFIFMERYTFVLDR